jgi:hypothetical protein
MDRIEPIRPSLPPIDATRVRRVSREREHPDQRRGGGDHEGSDEQHRSPDRQREWSTDDPQRSSDGQELDETVSQERADASRASASRWSNDEDEEGRHRIDVRA